jgi:catechol 2,3-dioxygenase-like lactoylglutathione lyase family enzyme
MTVMRMDNVGIVVADLDAAVAFFAELGLVLEGRTRARLARLGATVVAEVVDYEGLYRLCYLRGPEGILIGLAQQLAGHSSRVDPMDQPA